jgi:hypothetical protein
VEEVLTAAGVAAHLRPSTQSQRDQQPAFLQFAAQQRSVVPTVRRYMAPAMPTLRQKHPAHNLHIKTKQVLRVLTAGLKLKLLPVQHQLLHVSHVCLENLRAPLVECR